MLRKFIDIVHLNESLHGSLLKEW